MQRQDRMHIFLICFLTALVLNVSARAQQDSLYTVRDVEIDVTAESAAKAREQALQEGQVKAFEMLAEKLLSDEDRQSFEMPLPDTISRMIRNFEIQHEQSSSVRYIGTLTYSFQKDLVQEYFEMGGLSYSEIKRKPVLILPLYQTREKTVLWEDPNPWRMAWYQVRGGGGLVPVVVPQGGIADVRTVPDSAIFSKSPSDLEPLMERYNADGTIVAIATDTPEEIKVFLYEYIGDTLHHTRTVKTPKLSQEPFIQAAVSVLEELQKAWKTQTASDSLVESELMASVSFSGVQDWVRIQSQLESISLVTEVNVLSLAQDKAQVSIRFRGGEDNLRLALAQHDLRLGTPKVSFDPGVLGDHRRSGSVISYNLELMGR